MKGVAMVFGIAVAFGFACLALYWVSFAISCGWHDGSARKDGS